MEVLEVPRSDREGKTVTLGLTDPDSNEIVPVPWPRFAGDFVLDSQGDKEQIYVSGALSSPQLSVLRLSQSIDDTAWATSSRGTLYMTDNPDDIVATLRGSFKPGTTYAAVTPWDADNAPATCPAPGFPPNYLGVLDISTGKINPVNLDGQQVKARA